MMPEAGHDFLRESDSCHWVWRVSAVCGNLPALRESSCAARSWLSLPIHDWVAGCFLLYGAVRSRREWSTGRLYQVAAWAFNASLMCGAFLGHLEDWSAGAQGEEWISERALLVVIGLLFAISLCALVSTMAVRAARARTR